MAIQPPPPQPEPELTREVVHPLLPETPAVPAQPGTPPILPVGQVDAAIPGGPLRRTVPGSPPIAAHPGRVVHPEAASLLHGGIKPTTVTPAAATKFVKASDPASSSGVPASSHKHMPVTPAKGAVDLAGDGSSPSHAPLPAEKVLPAQFTPLQPAVASIPAKASDDLVDGSTPSSGKVLPAQFTPLQPGIPSIPAKGAVDLASDGSSPSHAPLPAEKVLPAQFTPLQPAIASIPATDDSTTPSGDLTPRQVMPAIKSTPEQPRQDSTTPTPSSSPPSGSGASGPPVHIDTDLIALGIPQVTDFANRITTIHATLMSTINGLGEPWGGSDDEYGRMFAESYLPARDQFDRGLTGTRGALDSTVEGINTMVRGYTDTENNNTVPFNNGES